VAAAREDHVEAAAPGSERIEQAGEAEQEERLSVE
jgi:hypothetical protein